MSTIAETFDDHWKKNRKGCWIWQRACKGKEVANGGGYGCLRVEGVMTAAHRFSYERRHGKIPKGKCIRHTCHQTKCVNPEHMKLGVNKDNVKDKMLAGRCSAKLTISQVKTIKRMAARGVFQRVIAEKFGIYQADVSNIVNRKYWSHVKI